MSGEWPRLRPGETVDIRGERWRVVQLHPQDACAILEVAGSDASNRGVASRFLLPFDRVHRVAAVEARPRIARAPALRHAMRDVLATADPEWTALRAAANARVSLLPFQLEPAIAVARGLATRLLLADDVGLGKTIQAGLVLAEVRARHPDARALIVTPAGLREQWRDELAERFEIAAEIVDAAALARASALLPPDVNPWSIPRVVIASIDFVKRPDVIRALETLVWDFLAFDEAHGLAGRSDRADAADLLASRARRVLLLSATPHSGDDRTFARLCSIGRLDDDRLLMFRRGRHETGCTTSRRTHMLRVCMAPAERRLHDELGAYARRVQREASFSCAAGARLAMGVLARRACSSPVAFGRSVARRAALLTVDSTPRDVQLWLPLDEHDEAGDVEPSTELGTPGLRNLHDEITQLERLELLAQRAAADERKVAALRRLLRRIGEPAIVFTEYRDTLAHLARALAAEDAPLLHGGMDAAERKRQLQRFTHGDAALLLATDAASEGLNLHRRCRLVINLEAPWTPLRFEQRFGRVDRLGQERRAHAITLVAAGTSETAVAERFVERQRRVQEATLPAGVDVISLRDDGRAEADRLVIARDLRARTPILAPRSRRPPAGFLGTSRDRFVLYWAWRLSFVDDRDDLVWQTVVAASASARFCGRPRSAADARRSFEAATCELIGPLDATRHRLHDARLERLACEIRDATSRLLRREIAIAAEVRRAGGRLARPLTQAGLFDRRFLRHVEAQRRVAEEALTRAAEHAAALERLRSPVKGEHVLVFLAGVNA